MFVCMRIYQDCFSGGGGGPNGNFVCQGSEDYFRFMYHFEKSPNLGTRLARNRL